MTWPALVLILTGAPMTGQETAAPQQGADAPPTVVLDDVEVTARRGAARVAPEREYDGAAIDAFGAWDISEVIARASERAGDREPPVIIINGRKVADPSIFLGFPPDAMTRLEVLPPQAAAMYGEAPNRRVMNLVMERRFKSTALQTGSSRPTSGGTSTLQGDLRRSSLEDQFAFNVGGMASITSSLRAGERSRYTLGQPGADAVTLRPETRLLTANIALSKPIGDWSSSLRLDIRAMSTQSTIFGGEGTTGNRSESDGLSVQGGLNGVFAGWNTQTQLTAGLSRTRQTGLTNSRLLTQTLGGTVSANRSLKSLPAGDLLGNLSAGAFSTWSETERTLTGAPRDDDDRTTQNAQFKGGFTVPLLRQKSPGSVSGPGFGDATLSLGGNLFVSDVGEGQGVDADLSWTPIRRLRINATLSSGSSAPDAQQLYAPLSYGEPVTVFDLVTGQSAQVIPILGGNPDLRAQRADYMSTGLALGPFTDGNLFFNLNYNRSDTRDGIGQLSAPTPALEAAFPDRFIRDAEGRLTAIDQRPLNLASATSDMISTSISGNLPLPWMPGDETQRLNISLSHTYRLSDISRFGPGEPVLDRLSGVGGGQPRQDAGVFLDTNRGRWGLNATGRWQSSYSLRRGDQPGPDDLEIDALATLNLRFTFNIQPRQKEPAATPGAGPAPRRIYAGGAQITLEIENLFDARPTPAWATAVLRPVTAVMIRIRSDASCAFNCPGGSDTDYRP